MMRAGRLLITLAITALLGASTFPIPAYGAEGLLPGDTPISVDITTPADGAVLPPGPATVTGKAAIGQGTAHADTALTYVLDVSGSTTAGNGGCSGDQNGDKVDPNPDDILDCEIAAAKELNNQAIRLATVDKVSVVVFGTDADTADLDAEEGDLVITDPEADGDHNGLRDVDEVLSSVHNRPGENRPNPAGGVQKFTSRSVGGGFTNFFEGITSAKLAAAAAETPRRIVVFMSDGLNNLGRDIDDLLDDAREKGIVFHTFAIGPNTACGSPVVGNTLAKIAAKTNGTCEPVSTMSELPDVLPKVIGSRLTSLSLSVDGGPAIPITNVTPALPQPGPITVDYTVTTEPLVTGAHRLCVTATGSDIGGVGDVTECRSVTVNETPVVDAGGPYTGAEDTQVPIAGTVTDPDGPNPTVSWSAKPRVDVAPGATCVFTTPTALSTTVSCTEHGTYDLILTVSDGLHPPVTDITTLTLTNVAPTVSAGGPYTGQDNVPVPITGTVVDPDSPGLTTTWAITPAAGVPPGTVCTFANATQLSTVVTCTGAGRYTLTLTVVDGTNPPVVARTTVTLGLRPGALSLAMLVNPATGFVGGDPIVVTHTVRNGGVTAMPSVRLTTALPAGLVPTAATPAGCARSCDLGTLAPGQIVQVRLTFAAAVATNLPISASVTTSGPDIERGDNAASGRVVIRQPVLTVDPGAGQQGFVTHAVGKDFPPGARIRLRWSIGISETPGEATIRPDGTLDAQALIFPKDTRGLRTLLVGPVNGPRFGEVRSNPFLVVARTLKPLTFVIR